MPRASAPTAPARHLPVKNPDEFVPSPAVAVDDYTARSPRARVEAPSPPSGAGRALATSMLQDFGTPSDGTGDRAKAEWVVRAPVGTELALTARHPRAGVARVTVILRTT